MWHALPIFWPLLSSRASAFSLPFTYPFSITANRLARQVAKPLQAPIGRARCPSGVSYLSPLWSGLVFLCVVPV